MDRDERRRKMMAALRSNPLLTDEDLAEQFNVSKATIRLDRQTLGIPQMRERMKTVIRRETGTGKAHQGLEILEKEPGKKVLALVNIDSSLVDKSGFVPAYRLYGMANSIARILVGRPLAPTQVGNIKYKKPVAEGTHLIVRSKIVRMRGNKQYIYVLFYEGENEVFRVKFIVDMA